MAMHQEHSPRLELSCLGLRALLIEFSDLYGEVRLKQVITSIGLPAHVTLEYLRGKDHWISMDAAEDLLDALVEAAAMDRFLRAAGRRSISHEVIGSGYSLIKAFGTVMLAYVKMLKSAHVYNRAGEFTTKRLGPSSIEIRYKSHRSERNRNFCEFRLGQMENFPAIWDLPRAHAHERECQVKGAKACVYVVRWREVPRLALPLLAGVAGAAAASLAAHLLTNDVAVPWVLLGAVAASAATITSRYRRALQERDALLGEHNDDLIDTMDALRERVAEVQKLNADLEIRVAERTQDLSVASDHLRDSLTREKDLAAVKSRFVANISHELRTPLTLILGPLNELIRRVNDPETQRTLGTVRSNAQALLRLVNMLLDYSSVEAGAARCNLERSNMGQLVESWVSNAQPQAQQLNLTLTTEGTADFPDTEFDHEKIETVFTNLLANALKFTPAGGRVVCRALVASSNVVVEVEDTGCGMTQEQANHVFERFYQAEEGAEKPQGTGIGLALAKEYADLHGGSLTVTSTPGQGSVFRLTLPKEPAVVERRKVARRREDRVTRAVVVGRDGQVSQLRREALLSGIAQKVTSSAPIPEIPTPPADAAHILLAEDNLELRQHMVSILSRHYHVQAVSNGAVALRLARAAPPDLVISDVQMPEMDGYDLCRALRKDSALGSIPFLFVTAWGATEQIVEGLQAGAVDYLVKPFGVEELLARIEAQLRARLTQNALDERNTRLAAIGQSAAAIAHDMKSPLQAVRGRAQLSLRWAAKLQTSLSKGAASADQECQELIKDLGAIVEAVEHSQNMTEKVLQFVRSGAETFEKRTVDLGPFLEHIARGIAPEMRAVGIDLQIDIDKQDDLTLSVDSLQLRRAVENLLHNAREALSALDNRPTKTVTVGLHAEGPSVIINITDNGIGIPPEIREQLFQPFVSARKANGTGLGLAVVYNVVTAHNGSITVHEAHESPGTIFTITLPRVAAKAIA